MAEFCKECAEKQGLPSDFDPEEMVKTMSPGEVAEVCCEGCGMNVISKGLLGGLHVGYLDDPNDGESQPLRPWSARKFEDEIRHFQDSKPK